MSLVQPLLSYHMCGLLPGVINFGGALEDCRRTLVGSSLGWASCAGDLGGRE